MLKSVMTNDNGIPGVLTLEADLHVATFVEEGIPVNTLVEVGLDGGGVHTVETVIEGLQETGVFHHLPEAALVNRTTVIKAKLILFSHPINHHYCSYLSFKFSLYHRLIFI